MVMKSLNHSYYAANKINFHHNAVELHVVFVPTNGKKIIGRSWCSWKYRRNRESFKFNLKIGFSSLTQPAYKLIVGSINCAMRIL